MSVRCLTLLLTSIPLLRSSAHYSHKQKCGPVKQTNTHTPKLKHTHTRKTRLPPLAREEALSRRRRRRRHKHGRGVSVKRPALLAPITTQLRSVRPGRRLVDGVGGAHFWFSGVSIGRADTTIKHGVLTITTNRGRGLHLRIDVVRVCMRV